MTDISLEMRHLRRPVVCFLVSGFLSIAWPVATNSNKKGAWDMSLCKNKIFGHSLGILVKHSSEYLEYILCFFSCRHWVLLDCSHQPLTLVISWSLIAGVHTWQHQPIANEKQDSHNVNDIWSLSNRVNITPLPSTYEGIGLVYLMAMLGCVYTMFAPKQ